MVSMKGPYLRGFKNKFLIKIMKIKNKRPKILCFVSRYLPGFKSGGPAKSIKNLIDHLSDKFDFVIVTSDRDLKDTKPYSSVQINSWNRIGKTKIYYASRSQLTFKFIKNIINNINYDILYLNSFFDFKFTTLPLIARNYFSKSYKPCVIAPRGEFSNAALNIKYFKKKIYILVTNLLGIFKKINWQASGKKEFKEILSNRKLKNNSIHIVGDLPIKVKNLNKIELKKNKKKKGKLKIVFLSRISPIKNIDFLLNVLKKVRKKINLSIYGPIEDPKYWRDCKHLIKKMPSNISIHYKGIVKPEKVYSTISSYDLFILPSRSESYGHAIIESLTTSTPVIISNKTPWYKYKNNGIISLPLNNKKKWILELEKWADLSDSQYSIRSLNAQKFAKSHLFNNKIVNQNKNFFLRFIN